MYSLERRDIYMLAMTSITLFGFISAQAMGSKDLFRCRQSCYQKFVQDWHHCMDFDGCKNMCITPPNINSYIPEAFSFLCWNNCDQQLGPFPLSINSAVRQGSLVITDIAWDQAITNASQQCLVTWEVSGGGLMGNLLTDSSTVELSLWSDTVYHVQVTCKHKDTGGMRRSYKLIVDTHKLGEFGATGMQSISFTTPYTKSLQHFYGHDVDDDDNDNVMPSGSDSGEMDTRMRILKDSSKDFLTPYNPNAIVQDKYSSLSSQEYQTTTIPTVISTTINSVSDSSSAKGKIAAIANNDQENEIMSTSRRTNIKRVHHHTNIAFTSIAEFFNATTLWLAILGAILLFTSLIVLYLLVKPTKKHVPATICPIDHEILIQNEVLPAMHMPPPAASGSATVVHATTNIEQTKRHHKTRPLRLILHV